MIETINISKIENVQYFGFDNFAFKELGRSYMYNSKRKFLLKLLELDGFTMTEEWFEETEFLNDLNAKILYDKLTELINQN